LEGYAVGIIIILKQLPHAFGYDADFEGESFVQANGDNSFSSLFEVFNHVQLGAIVITLVSLIILISWDPFFS
jgi:MFS superfamily sulfate permease-like transporter